jgi:hypothetical protein
MFKGSSPRNNIDFQKPNFYTELCCEWSGDAAREVDRLSNRAKVRQRFRHGGLGQGKLLVKV